MRLGKWASRDILGEIVLNNLYVFCHNNPIEQYDHIGLFDDGTQPPPVWEFDIGTPIYDFFKITIPIGYKKVPAVPDNHLGHSDFDGNDMFDYTKADHYFWTSPFNPFGIWNHFRNQTDLEKKVRDAIDQCNVKDFEYNMHYYQDAYVHYDNGYRAWPLHGWNPNHWFPGHASANLLLPIFNGMFGLGENPDNTTPNNKGYGQWMAANKKTKEFVGKWKANCCRVCKQYDSDGWMPKSSGNCL